MGLDKWNGYWNKAKAWVIFHTPFTKGQGLIEAAVKKIKEFEKEEIESVDIIKVEPIKNEPLKSSTSELDYLTSIDADVKMFRDDIGKPISQDMLTGADREAHKIREAMKAPMVNNDMLDKADLLVKKYHDQLKTETITDDLLTGIDRELKRCRHELKYGRS